MANKKTSEHSLSFEEALDKLEQVVRQLEDGQLGLSDSLARYEEGVRHLKYCHQVLGFAERKIQLLTSVDDDGNAEIEPLDDDESTGEQKNKARSRRRSKPSASRPDDDDAGDVDTQRGLF